jgi:multidrug resistance efflux pump
MTQEILPAGDVAPAAAPPAPRASAARRLRTALGVGLLLLTGWLGVSWLLTPGVWTITSTQAVVNARIMTLHAPLEGIVTRDPPPVGKAVASGAVLLEVENPLADNSKLEELRTEAASLDERVAALKNQHRVLEKLKEDLTASAKGYREAAVRRLERQVEEAESVAAASDAFQRQRQYKREQAERLSSAERGVLSQQELVTTQLASEAAHYKGTQAKAAARRLAEELELARSGNYFGPADGRNDVPYSQQRIHDIEIRQQDILARVQEFGARAAQVRKQTAIEAERLRRQSTAAVKAPIDGVVWRRPVVSGATVTRQTDALKLLDASDIFVDALVSEKYFGTIRPGDKAVIKLIGSHAEVPGTVRDVLGQVALGSDTSLAAEVPKLGKHEIHVVVTFDGAAAGDDNFHAYHIGQPVEVRFPESAGTLRRAWDLVSP